MGRVAAPYGVKGWMKVVPFTSSSGTLGTFARWWLGRAGQWEEVELVESAVHGATLLARIAGYDTREQAARLRGLEVAVPRAALAATAPGEYYWADLIGLEVVNIEGQSLGTVASVFSNGAHEVLRVAQDGAERLVPFVAAVVKKVDLAARRLEVEWGLDW